VAPAPLRPGLPSCPAAPLPCPGRWSASAGQGQARRPRQQDEPAGQPAGI
jgi:hypothetical protein